MAGLAIKLTQWTRLYKKRKKMTNTQLQPISSYVKLHLHSIKMTGLNKSKNKFKIWEKIVNVVNKKARHQKIMSKTVTNTCKKCNTLSTITIIWSITNTSSKKVLNKPEKCLISNPKLKLKKLCKKLLSWKTNSSMPIFNNNSNLIEKLTNCINCSKIKSTRKTRTRLRLVGEGQSVNR